MNTILQKRIEEVAKEIGKKFYFVGMNPNEAAYKASIQMGNKILQNQWISVDEDLPEYEEDVIVTNSYDDYWFAHRSNNEKVIVDEYGFARTPTVLRITHWMPIPEMKGDEE